MNIPYCFCISRFLHSGTTEQPASPFIQWGAGGGVTHPQTNALSANHQICHLCWQFCLLFAFLEHKKKNQVPWCNRKLVSFLHLTMKSSHVNKHSSIMEPRPFFQQNVGPTPQEKFLGTALVAWCPEEQFAQGAPWS